ncbi:MAG: CHRD domain-containing protein, partial [Thermoproteota archaeon]|nr:CHRD domain-containing protein [Thermoproteota archaeon]
MVTDKSTILVLTEVLVVGSITAISSVSHPSMVFANHEFAANLTGQQEVPPVDTQATGEAIFVVDMPKNETIDYFLNATGIQGATQGHIHSGVQGENGPVVVTLFSFDSPQNAISQNGTFAANNLEGPMAGKQLTDLITAMKNGSTYANFHT